MSTVANRAMQSLTRKADVLSAIRKVRGWALLQTAIRAYLTEPPCHPTTYQPE
jgi:hypothetical protein